MNIEVILDQVAAELDWLEPEPVFLGGAIIGLFLDRLGQSQLRPTLDVDCIAPQIVSRSAWWQLEAELRARRWSPSPSGPLCRYRSPSGHIVDLMSEDPSVLGFSGRWYPHVARAPASRVLSTGRRVLVPTPALLMACKLEAFHDRGAHDPALSKDLEDISALLDGCRELEASVGDAEPDVRDFIATHLNAIRDHATQHQVLLAQLPRGGDPEAQRARVQARLVRLTS